MRELLGPFGSLADWDAFADSWEGLELDPTWRTADVTGAAVTRLFAHRRGDRARAASAALSGDRLQPA